MTNNIIDRLKEKNLTISIAESMTGGLLSYSFTKNPGASKVFIGSVVAYNEEVKINLLNVDKNSISKHSVVSKEVANEMVLGLSKIIPASINISVTGNAGPSFDKNTIKLECFIGFKTKDELEVIKIAFKDNNRLNNINLVIESIMNKLLTYL